MRVLLVNPPAADGVKQVREGRCMQRVGAWTAVWTPISLALSAAVLRNDGAEVRLDDCIVEDIDFPELRVIIEEFRPQLLVMNAVTPAIDSDLSTARHVKEVDEGIKTAIIGIHGTALPEECLTMQSGLDFVIRGEPEYTIRDLARALDKGTPLSEVDGVSYRAGESIHHTSDRQMIDNLDELPFPAWDLIDRMKYVMPFTDHPFLLVATGRGCPFKCTFCADKAYYGTRLRLRSPQSVVDELEHNRKEFGIEDFLFWSESFTINRRFTMGVADEILRRGLKVRWVCNSRVDNVDVELLTRIKQAGCWMIGYGVEGGNQTVLDRVNKGITVQQTIDAIKMSKSVGLEVTAHCVVGLPGETKETISQTVQLMKDLDVDFAQFYCAVPFPGSDLYQEAREKGWITTDDWTMFEQNFSVLDTDTLTAQEVMELRRKAFRDFYLRPKIFWKVFRRTGFGPGFWELFNAGKEFLTWVK